MCLLDGQIAASSVHDFSGGACVFGHGVESGGSEATFRLHSEVQLGSVAFSSVPVLGKALAFSPAAHARWRGMR